MQPYKSCRISFAHWMVSQGILAKWRPVFGLGHHATYRRNWSRQWEVKTKWLHENQKWVKYVCTIVDFPVLSRSCGHVTTWNCQMTSALWCRWLRMRQQAPCTMWAWPSARWPLRMLEHTVSRPPTTLGRRVPLSLSLSTVSFLFLSPSWSRIHCLPPCQL